MPKQIRWMLVNILSCLPAVSIRRKGNGASGMKRNHLVKAVSAVALISAAILAGSALAFAGTPTLGVDCGVGASMVGSDLAGKVTLGVPTTSCTLTFGVPYTTNAPACSATNETNGGGNPIAIGAATTTTTLVLASSTGWATGDIISYSCQEY